MTDHDKKHEKAQAPAFPRPQSGWPAPEGTLQPDVAYAQEGMTTEQWMTGMALSAAADVTKAEYGEVSIELVARTAKQIAQEILYA